MSDPVTAEHYELASVHIASYKPSHNADDCISDATSTENDLLKQQQQQEQSQSPTLREDRYWSFFSNSFFVAGCFFSLAGNSWDYILYTKFNYVGEDLQAMSDKWQYNAPKFKYSVAMHLFNEQYHRCHLVIGRNRKNGAK